MHKNNLYLDYELDDISEKLEEIEEDAKEYGRYISDDLEILSDYYDLLEDERLTLSEFNKYKAQCLHRIKTIKYISDPNVDSLSLKFAHSLFQRKCLTRDEYEMIKQRMQQIFAESQQKKKEKRIKEIETQEEREYQEELNLSLLVLKVIFIPFKILFWLIEVWAVGFDKVWLRDEIERIKHDND